MEVHANVGQVNILGQTEKGHSHSSRAGRISDLMEHSQARHVFVWAPGGHKSELEFSTKSSL